MRGWEHGVSRSTVVLGLAVLAASALNLLTVPPREVAVAALVAWVPLLALAGKIELRQAVLAGWIHGILVNAAGQHWIHGALRETAGLPASLAALTFVVVVLWQAGRYAMILGITSFLVERGRPVWLVFPPLLVLAEGAYPYLFPWGTALGVHDVPVWLQLAAFGGASAVALWIAMVNASLAAAVRACREPRVAARHGLAAAAVLSFATLTGWLEIRGADATAATAEAASVGIVHESSTDPLTMADPVKALRDASARITSGAEALSLLVWPEAALDTPTRSSDLPRLARDYLLRDRRDGSRGPTLSTPLLLGLVLKDEQARLFNAAVLVRSPGILDGFYAKRALVPLGEQARLASWWPASAVALPVVTEYTPGDSARGVRLGTRWLGVSICYEDLLANRVRDTMLASKPELLVNLTSDAWFRATSAPELHLALARLRSVEHRRFLVRATRDGVSGVIDNAGRVKLRFSPDRTLGERAEIRWLQGSTPYTRFGALWVGVLALGWLLWTVVGPTLSAARTRSGEARRGRARSGRSR